MIQSIYYENWLGSQSILENLLELTGSYDKYEINIISKVEENHPGPTRICGNIV